uniref:Rhomboid domain containing 2 n=1 Tax=Mastacembelus armatus TaxID=205130 RepID=A0A7N8YK01_9TELE
MLALLSCVLFGVQMYFSLTQGLFSVGAAVFQSVHLHRLFMFPFYHRSSAQLLLNITALLFLSSSLEKGVGTVRFLFLFLLMSTTTGLCFSFLDLLQDDSSRSHAEGLFPTMALPWVLLIITTAVIPHSVLLCNVTSILIGWMYGKGWFSHVDMSEARAGIVEKMMPFRWLRRISGVMFVPASTEERRKTLLPQINPTPGSYPVQAYAPLSNINTAPMTYEGWANSASALAGPPPPLIFMDSFCFFFFLIALHLQHADRDGTPLAPLVTELWGLQLGEKLTGR